MYLLYLGLTIPYYIIQTLYILSTFSYRFELLRRRTTVLQLTSWNFANFSKVCSYGYLLPIYKIPNSNT